jgi:hypothetical protein
MADSKISALPASTTPLAGTEVLPIVQSSTTKQVSIANVTAGRAISALSYVPTGSAIPVNGLFLPGTNIVGLATNSTEQARIDATGNLLVGTTTSPSGSGNLAVGQGQWAPAAGYFQLIPKFTGGSATYYFYDNSTGFFSLPDNTQALGNASYRWTTVYATTALINTSDANTKQQIRDLNTAEKAVAQSIKGLIKAFKFNDSVAEKGDGARIHIGVIAQDVQSAFVAEGLDPTKYAMFCSDTWYEVDGQAHNKKDGFYTKDSPNAVEVTRLGVRYEELLAFVIASL